MSTSELFEPKYVTFDCYGTLIWFQMSATTRRVMGAKLPDQVADAFLKPANDLFVLRVAWEISECDGKDPPH